MTKVSIIIILLFSGTVLAHTQTVDSNWIGSWVGSLEIPGTNSIKLVFHLQKTGDQWFASMDSPDQLQYGIEISEVQIKGDSIMLGLPKLNAKMLGVYKEGKIIGSWQQGMRLPLSLTKDDRLKPKSYPQHPQPPFPYSVEELSFENTKAKIKLAGTLTLPPNIKEEQQVPVILLISGSGPQDRDETIAGHKPFWVIADHFSRRGFAVLRVDDRGVGQSEGNQQNATTADFVTDVLAAVDFLRQQPNINPRQVILMGHSEGALIAFMAAAKAKRKIAIVVSLAGPAVPITDLLYRQSKDLLLQDGHSERLAEIYAQFSQKIYQYVIADKRGKLSIKDLVNKMQVHFDAIPENDRDSLQLTEAVLAQSCMTVMSPWFRYFIEIDPQRYLKKLRCPVLALNGGKDIQVAADENLEVICQTLRKKGRRATCTEIPKLNHLFQNCKSCTIQEYGEVEETFAPEVLKAMEGWLRRQLF